jgi:TrmH family RNA methyltransferase
VITSPHNAGVAAARKLLQRKERAAAGAFLVEGPHAVGEALRSSSHSVRQLFVTPDAATRDVELLRLAAASGLSVTLVSDRVAAALGDTRRPQGVVAVVGTPHHDLGAVVARAPGLVVVLAEVADPGNAGTVIRTADAAGADAVVLTRGSVDPYGGKCVRASAGSLFHLPVVTGVTLDAAIAVLRQGGLTVLATTLDGEDIDEVDLQLRAPVAWLFGNEAHGLPVGSTAAADRVIRIPIHGRAESLNLAAAAAVCLYATMRARRASDR